MPDQRLVGDGEDGVLVEVIGPDALSGDPERLGHPLLLP